MPHFHIQRSLGIRFSRPLSVVTVARIGSCGMRVGMIEQYWNLTRVEWHGMGTREIRIGRPDPDWAWSCPHRTIPFHRPCYSSMETESSFRSDRDWPSHWTVRSGLFSTPMHNLILVRGRSTTRQHVSILKRSYSPSLPRHVSKSNTLMHTCFPHVRYPNIHTYPYM